jgi:hypothetical protein
MGAAKVTMAIAWGTDKRPVILVYTPHSIPLDGPGARAVAARLLNLADTWDDLTDDTPTS